METKKWVKDLNEERKIIACGTLNLKPLVFEEAGKDGEDIYDCSVVIETLGKVFCGKRDVFDAEYRIANTYAERFFKKAKNGEAVPYIVIDMNTEIPKDMVKPTTLGDRYKYFPENKMCRYIYNDGIADMCKIKTNEGGFSLADKKEIKMYTTADGFIIFKVR